jgi:glycosyltransferase involved in cell wall biosynthesis
LTYLKCSVVVATCNRAFLLNRLLQSLATQDIDPSEFEVVVVDDGSKDGTQLLLQEAKWPFRLRSFRQENQGPAAARNVAIQNAEADVIVTLDDDVIATPSLLRRHLELHATGEPIAAMGVMALNSETRLKPWLEWDALTLDKQYQAMIRGDWRATPRQFYTANASFRRQDAIQAGLFDPQFRRAEDVELGWRMLALGVRFEFLPDAIVFHEPNRSYKNWLRVPWLYGHYDVMMFREKGLDHIMTSLRQDFDTRKPMLRSLARVLVGRRFLLQGFCSLATILASVVSSVGLRRPGRMLYSAIFNLQYWQGFCEAMGDRSAFWQSIDSLSVKALPEEHVAGYQSKSVGES